MLISTHFAGTSAIAEDNGKVVGLVSGYRIPEFPEIFFVWQVAVHPSLRAQGIALKMLKSLLERGNLDAIHFIDTTIAPDNQASQRLFTRLAAELETKISRQPLFDKTLFGEDAHENEDLYRIGPIMQDETTEGN